MEGGGTNGSHLPADMTCRDVGHGSVALLRARRYRSEQLLSGTVEESIVARGLRKGVIQMVRVCPPTPPGGVRRAVLARDGGDAAPARAREGPASSCLPPAATHATRARPSAPCRQAHAQPQASCLGAGATALSPATCLVVLFILAIHPWPGIDVSAALTWQLSAPRRLRARGIHRPASPHSV